MEEYDLAALKAASEMEAEKYLDEMPDPCPVRSMADAEQAYRAMLARSAEASFGLGAWLPGFRSYRALWPGEMMVIVAHTGQGKSACLQNIAQAAAPLPVLLFELELPMELVFERQMGIVHRLAGAQVELNYQVDRPLKIEQSKHIWLCSEPKITLSRMETIIELSEEIIGKRPAIVMLDYIQLIQGEGSRYERLSDTADGLKRLARACNVVLIVASQSARPPDRENPTINLHSAKDSGNIENSAGVVLGFVRDPEDQGLGYVKVLKYTKGRAGIQIAVNFGDDLRITERADMPEGGMAR